MQVNSASSVPPVSANTVTHPVSTTATNALDSAQFMQILLAQLTHQNPLEPMSNSDMMNQFSQLNSLQELQGIHTILKTESVSSQTTYLASLIGKTVKANRPDGKTIEGVVDGVVTANDKPQLLIGSETVDLSNVVEIKGAIK